MYWAAKQALWHPKRATLTTHLFTRFSYEPHNQLCINDIAPTAQNSRISHQRFLGALNWEYWALEMQILSGKLTAKQEFISEVTVLGRALTKTFIHMPFVVTPYGFMILFGEWDLRERCSRHPSSKRYHEWCRSITVPTKEKQKKHKVTQWRRSPVSGASNKVSTTITCYSAYLTITNELYLIWCWMWSKLKKLREKTNCRSCGH